MKLTDLIGSTSAWQGRTAPSRVDWLRTVLVATLLAAWAYRRLLWKDFQFVGNDSDLSYAWIPRFRFTRLWFEAGEAPFWNPFLGLGKALTVGPEHPYSLLNLLQRCWPDFDKGLDYSLFALALGAGASAALVLLWLRFVPWVSVIGALLWSCSGMVVTQLFSGHVGIFAAFCLCPLLFVCTLWSMNRSALFAVFPACLAVAAVLACGDLQAAHIVLCLWAWFFLLRAALGSPDPVAPPAVRSSPSPATRPGMLLAAVPPQLRAQELFFTCIRLLLIVLGGLYFSQHLWLPMLRAGELAQLPADVFGHSAPVISWMNVLIPHLFLGAGEEYTWVGWGHWEGQVGLSTSTALLLWLLLFRPRRDLLLPLLVAFPLALLAAGDSLAFYGLYSRLDPFIAYFEVPSRFYYGVNVALCLLACCSLQNLNEGGWELSPAARRWSLRLAALAALCWLLTYNSDGLNPFWLSFQQKLQSGYRYMVQPRQTPAEYYVLFWMRLTAALALNGALLYCLVRLPRRGRPLAVAVLLGLDVTRIAHAYLNLRPTEDFLPAHGLSEVFAKSSSPGRVVNRVQPLWTGSFAMLRLFEFSQILDPNSSESKLLEAAQKHAPELASLEAPNALTRSLGAEFYVHPKELLKDPNWTRICAGLVNYTSPDGDWSVTQDKEQRAMVYLARNFQPAGSWRTMLETMNQPGFRPQENLCFVSPSVSTSVLAEVRRKGYDRLAPLQVARAESCELTQVLPNSIYVRCFLKAPALVVLNQAWSPEWRVSVDLEPADCLPCQLGLNRGVLVGPGEHEVRFSYEPGELTGLMRRSWTGFVLVLVGCLALLGLEGLIKWATESRS